MDRTTPGRVTEILAGLYAALAVCGEVLAWRSTETVQVVGALLLLSVVARLLTGERRSTVPAAFIAWAAIVVLAIASLAWTVDVAATRRVCLHLAQEGVLLAALALCPRRDRLLLALAVGAALGALVLALGYIGAFALLDPRGKRLALWEGDTNQQARGAVLGLLLGLAFARGRVLLFALLLGVGVGLTASRGAWLAGLLGLALVAWRPPRSPVADLRWSALAAVVGLAVGATLLVSRPDVRSPLPNEDREALTSGRDAIWLNTLEMVRDHPVLGVGAGASPAAYDPYYLAREARGGLHSKPGRDPHNHYLQLLAELGPLGLLLFALGLAFVAVDIRRAPGFGRRALPVLMCVLVGAATVSSQELKVFWLGLAWATLAAAAPGGHGRIALTVPGRRVRPPGLPVD